jgi:hypothetical protein
MYAAGGIIGAVSANGPGLFAVVLGATLHCADFATGGFFVARLAAALALGVLLLLLTTHNSRHTKMVRMRITINMTVRVTPRIMPVSAASGLPLLTELRGRSEIDAVFRRYGNGELIRNL